MPRTKEFYWIAKLIEGLFEQVELPSGQKKMAVSYQLVDTEDDMFLPSGVYKDVIIQGAREHNMPQDYIHRLKAIQDNGYHGEVNA